MALRMRAPFFCVIKTRKTLVTHNMCDKLTNNVELFIGFSEEQHGHGCIGDIEQAIDVWV